MGFLGPEKYIASELELKLDPRSNYQTSGGYATSVPKVFAAGGKCLKLSSLYHLWYFISGLPTLSLCLCAQIAGEGSPLWCGLYLRVARLPGRWTRSWPASPFCPDRAASSRRSTARVEETIPGFLKGRNMHVGTHFFQGYVHACRHSVLVRGL